MVSKMPLAIFFTFLRKIIVSLISINIRNSTRSTLSTVSFLWWHSSTTASGKMPPESESESCPVMSDSLQHHWLYSPWNSSGQNTGELGSHSLLQGLFPTQGSNPGLPHCRQILYKLSHQGSPRILEWVAYPFSKGSSQPRDQTQVSHIAGGFFPIREAQEYRSG